MPRRTTPPALGALAGLLLLAGGAAPVGAAGEVGRPAADFSLQDLQGNTHTLAEHRGKAVLLCIVGYG